MHLPTYLYFCSEDADTVLVTLVTLFIYFFTIHVHSFHKGRVVVVEVHCFVSVVMFAYYLISVLILLDLLPSNTCAVLKVIHILVYYARYIAKAALNNCSCLFDCAELLY